MTEAELVAALESLNIPVIHYDSSVQVALPYIVYWAADGNVRGSDHTNGIREVSYLVELYIKKDDTESQASLEALFDSYGIKYGFSGSYLPSESMVLVAYYVTLTTKIRRNQS